MLESIPEKHPRIILTDERVAELRTLLKEDEDLQTLVAGLQTAGEALLQQPPVSYDLKGVKRFRLLGTSRRALGRVLVLGTLYRLRGEEKWKTRLTAELMAVCQFRDWHHKHFLDTAEMSAAVALGYDWLYPELSEAERATIREGLVKHGIDQTPRNGWWVRGHNNWNQVCHGGMVLAALAVAHEEPAKAEALLQSAKKNFVTGMKAYAPAGVFPEGPGYWNYGTAFSVLMDSAVKSVTGADWGILAMPGFRKSFFYRMHVQGPTGHVVNYADGGTGASSSPYHFHLAAETRAPGLRTFAMDSMQADLRKIVPSDSERPREYGINRFYPLAVAWYLPREGATDIALDWFGTEGEEQVHLATMRSAWEDRNALFASMKAGVLAASHSHLDTGSFVLESDGVRWAWDLGSEKEVYDRNDSWSLKQDSKRWSFFRLNNYGHNTLTIDNQLHRVKGTAPIVASGSGDSPFAIADLSAAFAGQATKVRRGLALPGRKQVVVQDEIEGVAKGKAIRWTLLTRAEVALSEDGRTAVLTQDDKALTASVLTPEGATFRVTDAIPEAEYENQNAGYRRLLVDFPSPGTPVRLGVRFTPGPQPGAGAEIPPLAAWREE